MSSTPERSGGWPDRIKTTLPVLTAATALVTWFVGDVPRVARLSLAALAATMLLLLKVAGPIRFVAAAAPILALVALAAVPGSRSWLLEQRRTRPAGPLLAIEDVRFAVDLGPARDPASPQRLRIDVALRSRAPEPVVVNRVLIGYHQGEFAGAGTHTGLWLADRALAVAHSGGTRTVIVPQSERRDDPFAVPVAAFASSLGASLVDEVLELRPQSEIPPNGLHFLQVTVPLTLSIEAASVTGGKEELVTRPSGRASVFADVARLDGLPRLLTVTAITTGGRCAQRVVEAQPATIPDLDPSRRRRELFLFGRRLRFEQLCSWSPPPLPEVEGGSSSVG